MTKSAADDKEVFLFGADRKTDWLVSVGLALLVVATRLPFRTYWLYNWDSANFALGTRYYDVSVHAPHPPGYFFYVAVANLFNLITGEANTSFVAESVLFSVGAVILVYFLGKAMFSRWAGLIAALLLTFSVTFWSYGGLALAYVSLAFFSSLVALFAWRILFAERDRPNEEARVPAKASTPGAHAVARASGLGFPLLLSLSYVLGSGFRPDLLLFLCPLWLWVLWRQNWKTRLICVGAALAGFLLWFVPTALLSGGFAQYAAVFTAYTQTDVADRYSSTHKGLAGLLVNLRDTLSYTFYALYVATLPLVAAALWFLTRFKLWLRRETVFFLVWTAPMLVFYIIIHVGDPGYIFTFLPAIMVLLGGFLSYLPGVQVERKLWASLVLVAAIVAANVGVFLFHPRPMTAQGIRQHDQTYEEKLSFLSSNVEPRRNLLLTYDSYKHLLYYLPDYRQSLWVDVFSDAEAEVPIPPGVNRIILVDERLRDIDRSPQITKEIPLPSGGKMYSLDVKEGQVLRVGGKAIEVHD